MEKLLRNWSNDLETLNIANCSVSVLFGPLVEFTSQFNTFWGEALSTLVYTLARTPSAALPNTTPYEAWFGVKPDVSNLGIFGSLVYVHVQKDKRGALGSHMEKCIFLGYAVGYKGWRFYNPATKRCIISERAVFDERYQLRLQN